jgi:hypothetical protein
MRARRKQPSSTAGTVALALIGAIALLPTVIRNAIRTQQSDSLVQFAPTRLFS